VYNIICDSLGMDPSPNSGQLRLPFKPVGLHSDENAPKLETPDDLPVEGTGPAIVKPPSQPAIPATPSPPTIPTAPTTPTAPSAPSELSTEEGQKEEKPAKGQSIWERFDNVFEDIKDRISKIFVDSK
jgi:hypothetical protein